MCFSAFYLHIKKWIKSINSVVLCTISVSWNFHKKAACKMLVKLTPWWKTVNWRGWSRWNGWTVIKWSYSEVIVAVSSSNSKIFKCFRPKFNFRLASSFVRFFIELISQWLKNVCWAFVIIKQLLWQLGELKMIDRQEQFNNRCQFHQRFYIQIFHTNVVSAAFPSYILALAKNSYKIRARKMLMKLTAGGIVIYIIVRYIKKIYYNLFHAKIFLNDTLS